MFKNLIELTKVRIGFLVLTTTIIGFYLGSQGKINNLLLSIEFFLGFLCSLRFDRITFNLRFRPCCHRSIGSIHHLAFL